MRQSLAKASRRSIRRALGENAVQALNGNASAVNLLAAQVQELQTFYDAVLEKIDADVIALKVQAHRHWWQRG